MGANDWEREFERRGLGYRLYYPELQTTFIVERLKRSSGELHGDLTVNCTFPGASGYNGVIFTGRFNFSSAVTRNTLAKALALRVPQDKGDRQLDWPGFLLELCHRVMEAEREGTPFVEVGQRPARINPLPLVEPLLPLGKATILFGDGGVGKSMMAVAMGVTVATGEPVVPGFLPHGRGPVLYLDYETDEDDLDERIKRVARGAQVPLPTFHYRFCARPLPDMVEDVAKVVAETSAVLVIVDSVGAAMGAGGEHADPADTAVRFFTALRVLGTTCLLIDHVSKFAGGQAGGAGKPYGSTYKVNLARSTWEMRQGARRNDGAVPVALYHRKSNVGPLNPAIGLAITFDTGEVYFEPDEITDPELAASLPLAERIAMVLGEGEELDLGALSDAVGSTRGAVSSALHRHKERFVSVGRGKWTLAS